MQVLKEMASDLALSEEYIYKFSHRTFMAYKCYKKACKNGKKRTICEPSAELKTLQYWVLDNVLSRFPVSEYSTAYEKNCSVRVNAYKHHNGNHILHTDIKNFFESISALFVHKLLEEYYSAEEISFLMDIVLLNGKMVVGSITAPKLANCIMYQFDKEIEKELQEIQKITYTRYADDIIVSSNLWINPVVCECIKSKLESMGLCINEKKTYYSNRASRRVVTGVVIDNNNNSLSIGWRKYKKLKGEIYKFLVYDNKYESRTLKRDNLIGQLAYLKSINPNRYHSLKKAFKKYRNYEQLFS